MSVTFPLCFSWFHSFVSSLVSVSGFFLLQLLPAVLNLLSSMTAHPFSVPISPSVFSRCLVPNPLLSLYRILLSKSDSYSQPIMPGQAPSWLSGQTLVSASGYAEGPPFEEGKSIFGSSVGLEVLGLCLTHPISSMSALLRHFCCQLLSIPTVR